MKMMYKAFVLTKCYDEGVNNLAVIEARDWYTAAQYIVDRPEQFESFLHFLRYPKTVDEFEMQIRNNYLDGDSWPEIRLHQIDTVYGAG